ncbi:sugar phosphate isomerase/epimerase family protein [Marinimicrobium alkaliphilum]|uniref:sugar phosphate isomerase/epimerase family protein n=1 Tax=Marinimicrobium alkaliphilum TaxID=2202654 RepID=UPI000DB97B9B|nr:sugar phosphate isomerase/epimerase [Marinimicrobium alkaliphilum]
MKLFKPVMTALLSAVFAFSSAVSAHNHGGSTEPGVSVQLWSVNRTLADDFEGTIKALGEMGFDGVELAGDYGPYGDDPEGLKAFLAEHGLKVSGAHVHFDAFNEDNFDDTVAFFTAVGAKKLIIPMDHRAFTDSEVDNVVTDLVRYSEKLEPYGLKTGYHNHAEEFDRFGDTTYWDYIAASTPERVVLQLDVGWVVAAGKDPEEYVRRYPGRTLTAHIKAGLPDDAPADAKPILGQDVADWKGVIQAMKEVGGTRWLVLEQEVYPDGMTQLEAVQASMNGLQEILSDL